MGNKLDDLKDMKGGLLKEIICILTPNSPPQEGDKENKMSKSQLHMAGGGGDFNTFRQQEEFLDT
jgi:hypothetical protein